MTPSQLKLLLDELPQDKHIICQVVDEHGKAWNMFYTFEDDRQGSYIQLRVYHPDLKSLPDIKV